MEKKIKISTAHTDNKLDGNGQPRQEMTLRLVGGSPWFTYIWIDDQCYAVHFGGRNYQIKRIK